jgi:hypothetical protein
MLQNRWTQKRLHPQDTEEEIGMRDRDKDKE